MARPQIPQEMIPVVQAIPRAPYTWESRAVLRGNQQQSGVIRLPFTRPTVIVGCHVSVTPITISAPAKLIETPDDIDVLVEMDRGDRFTSLDMDGNNSVGQFVTLTSLDQVRGGRYLEWIFDISAPVLQITYRHQRDVGSLAFEDVLCKLSFYANYLDISR
jgi:hypothetical protein